MRVLRFLRILGDRLTTPQWYYYLPLHFDPYLTYYAKHGLNLTDSDIGTLSTPRFKYEREAIDRYNYTPTSTGIPYKDIDWYTSILPKL